MKPYKIERINYAGANGRVAVVLRKGNVWIGWVWKDSEGWWYSEKDEVPCAEPYCTRADAAETLWMMALIHVDK